MSSYYLYSLVKESLFSFSQIIGRPTLEDFDHLDGTLEFCHGTRVIVKLHALIRCAVLAVLHKRFTWLHRRELRSSFRPDRFHGTGWIG